MNTAYITIVTSIGSFATSVLSIYLGYLLIVSGVDQPAAGVAIKAAGIDVNLFSFVPGLIFAFFGAALAAWTVHRTIGGK